LGSVKAIFNGSEAVPERHVTGISTVSRLTDCQERGGKIDKKVIKSKGLGVPKGDTFFKKGQSRDQKIFMPAYISTRPMAATFLKKIIKKDVKNSCP
jgi:hypothetical protein